MGRKLTIAILVGSVLWWLFPDFFPGPIDDLISFMVTIISSIGLLATKAKATQDAMALLASETTTQSS